MIKIKKFVFNTFMVNTYLVYDETGECMLIDAACYDPEEQEEISVFIKENSLKLLRNLNTHCHIDHVLGNDFIARTYHVRPEYHRNSVPFFHTAREIGSSFGFLLDSIPEPLHFLEDEEIVQWGKSSLKVLFTPGHAEGSVCFYSEPDGFVITGDVLFRDTIGRTDLPSGDFDQLMTSIKTRLFTLPPETVVYPGHGPETTIGYEMENNPFIR
jgi:glyoxylase-like metal-dependent hydrolase (beta-lactamase superfamily II)